LSCSNLLKTNCNCDAYLLIYIIKYTTFSCHDGKTVSIYFFLEMAGELTIIILRSERDTRLKKQKRKTNMYAHKQKKRGEGGGTRS